MSASLAFPGLKPKPDSTPPRPATAQRSPTSPKPRSTSEPSGSREIPADRERDRVAGVAVRGLTHFAPAKIAHPLPRFGHPDAVFYEAREAASFPASARLGRHRHVRRRADRGPASATAVSPTASGLVLPLHLHRQHHRGHPVLPDAGQCPHGRPAGAVVAGHVHLGRRAPQRPRLLQGSPLLPRARPLPAGDPDRVPLDLPGAAFSHAVRLFANMLAGYILLITFGVLCISVWSAPALVLIQIGTFPGLVAFTASRSVCR